MLSWALFFICKIYLIRLIHIFTNNSTNTWCRLLFAPKLLSLISWFLPVILLHSGIKTIEGIPDFLIITIERITLIALVVLTIRSLSILLWKANDIYAEHEMSRNRPIKGIIQVIILILYGVGSILIVATLLNKSPWFFLSGLGAMTAVLLLVFRDTILSLVAGVQLTSNGLVRVGDWIEMPQFQADGDVIDIALHSVKVQNWDKTITNIPTHKFLENSFKNWRGMQESGGRRVKRSILIDISTIRFLSEDEQTKLSNFSLLQKYMKQKINDLKEYNSQFEPELQVNARRLTNIGTFRSYLVNYLKQHPKVSPNMTFLVRQLESGDHGLPIEVYLFINDVRWAVYEEVQADIFDHIFSILPEFGLRVHQRPTGYDLRSFGPPV